MKIWWIAATNPLVSMPNLNFVKKALLKCPLIILNESYEQSESIKYAHLVLPAAQWSEKDGVMTNSERRVTFAHLSENRIKIQNQIGKYLLN